MTLNLVRSADVDGPAAAARSGGAGSSSRASSSPLAVALASAVVFARTFKRFASTLFDASLAFAAASLMAKCCVQAGKVVGKRVERQKEHTLLAPLLVQFVARVAPNLGSILHPQAPIPLLFHVSTKHGVKIF